MWLIFKRISALMIGMIADVTEIELLHEAKRSVVEREPEDRHVVRVHHSMLETHRLPAGDEPRGALDDFGEKVVIPVGLFREFGEIFGDDVIREQPEVVVLP